MRTGPERELVETYIERAKPLARQLGLKDISVTELDVRTGGQQAESEAVLASTPAGAQLWALDERGKPLKTDDMAKTLRDLHEQGVPDLCLAIGGADGHTRAVRERADRLLAFGPQVWPHKLVRVMAAEQLYRCLSILTGHPYHRV